MSPSLTPLDVPIVALFPDAALAFDAIAATAATFLSSPAPGVVLLRPGAGLSERLYAAGAALVVA